KNIKPSGSCGCGAVGFTATGKPKFVGLCHCSDCRNYTGAAFSTFVGFLDEQVKWQGEAQNTYASSPA
ncbi:MAG: GFA family protein, partial [Robiginitomaculum sp.]|nr:GFA family protein [Robiginitomaculum sp.]